MIILDECFLMLRHAAAMYHNYYLLYPKSYTNERDVLGEPLRLFGVAALTWFAECHIAERCENEDGGERSEFFARSHPRREKMITTRPSVRVRLRLYNNIIHLPGCLALCLQVFVHCTTRSTVRPQTTYDVHDLQRARPQTAVSRSLVTTHTHTHTSIQ